MQQWLPWRQQGVLSVYLRCALTPSLRWLESQLTAAQDAAVAATEAARNAESKCGVSAAQAAQSQHSAEMSHVEHWAYKLPSLWLGIWLFKELRVEEGTMDVVNKDAANYGAAAQLTCLTAAIPEQQTGHQPYARVKGALLRKEEAVSAAQQQVAALTSQLHATEAALAQHQAELQLLA
eukprot:1154746-Pelagomonas_calceolata.AAC.5